MDIRKLGKCLKESKKIEMPSMKIVKVRPTN
jgi:hypothetical protein